MKISWKLLVEEYWKNLEFLGWETLKQSGKYKDFKIAWIIRGFWNILDDINSFGIVSDFLVGEYWKSLRFFGLSIEA